MKLNLREPNIRYSSGSQISRDITEAWVAQSLFCPNCGNPKLTQFPANLPVADFFCSNCQDQYELKSQKKPFGKTLANGAYSTKMERLNSNSSPNLILLNYEPTALTVENLSVIPKRFFNSQIIKKRKPLGPNARRAGWVGSNILLGQIPSAGVIPLIKQSVVLEKIDVLEAWRKTAFLNNFSENARGWLLEVMKCVDRVSQHEFSLGEIYKFESELRKIYPQNHNIRPKIRQQLQVLRDNGYLEFLGNGNYRLR